MGRLSSIRPDHDRDERHRCSTPPSGRAIPAGSVGRSARTNWLAGRSQRGMAPDLSRRRRAESRPQGHAVGREVLRHSGPWRGRRTRLDPPRRRHGRLGPAGERSGRRVSSRSPVGVASQRPSGSFMASSTVTSRRHAHHRRHLAQLRRSRQRTSAWAASARCSRTSRAQIAPPGDQASASVTEAPVPGRSGRPTSLRRHAQQGADGLGVGVDP